MDDAQLLLNGFGLALLLALPILETWLLLNIRDKKPVYEPVIGLCVDIFLLWIVRPFG